MPRAKPLPEGVEQDPATKKVRCLICKEADPTGSGHWINKSSLKGHLDSDAHATEVLRKRERDEQSAADIRRLNETYSGADTIPNSDFRSPELDARPGLFDPGPDFAQNSDFDMRFAEPLVPVYMEPLVHDPEVERERLRRQVQDMLLEAEHEDEFGRDDDDDDLTVPNIADEFQALGISVLIFCRHNLTEHGLQV